MRRRSFLAGLAAGATGGLLAGMFADDIIDEDSDLPYRISAAALERLDGYIGPGDPVPGPFESVLVPDDYQDYIDPSLEEELEDLEEVAYERDIMDWKRPREYLTEGGDCEDYATAAASVIEREGGSARVVIGSLDGVGHVIAEDETGQAYSVGQGATELDDWEPVLMFSEDEQLQGYRPRD